MPGESGRGGIVDGLRSEDPAVVRRTRWRIVRALGTGLLLGLLICPLAVYGTALFGARVLHDPASVATLESWIAQGAPF